MACSISFFTSSNAFSPSPVQPDKSASLNFFALDEVLRLNGASVSFHRSYSGDATSAKYVCVCVCVWCVRLCSCVHVDTGTCV